MWPSFLVTIPQGFVAAADWSIAWEKYSLESGDNNWKATLAEPADSKKLKLRSTPFLMLRQISYLIDNQIGKLT